MLRIVYDSLAAIVLLFTAWQAVRHRRADPASSQGLFSLVAASGIFYLALDEMFSLHERLGHAMYYNLGWREPPGINHFDDLIVMVVALAGLITIAIFWREVLEVPRFAALFAVGLAAFAAAVAWDAVADPTKTASWWTEETLELLGAAVMAVAFGVRRRLLGQ